MKMINFKPKRFYGRIHRESYIGKSSLTVLKRYISVNGGMSNQRYSCFGYGNNRVYKNGPNMIQYRSKSTPRRSVNLGEDGGEEGEVYDIDLITMRRRKQPEPANERIPNIEKGRPKSTLRSDANQINVDEIRRIIQKQIDHEPLDFEDAMVLSNILPLDRTDLSEVLEMFQNITSSKAVNTGTEKSSTSNSEGENLYIDEYFSELKNFKSSLESAHFGNYCANELLYKLKNFTQSLSKDLNVSYSTLQRYEILYHILERLFKVNDHHTFILDTIFTNLELFDCSRKEPEDYNQLPDHIRLDEFAMELRNLQESLGAGTLFSDFTPDEVLSQLKTMYESFDENKLSDEAYWAYRKLYNNLKLLFKINGGYTFILDTVLDNQFAFAEFEIKKKKLKTVDTSEEYKQLPPNLHIEDFISELRDLRSRLGEHSTFSDYAPTELLIRLKSVIGSSDEGHELHLSYEKLYHNLKVLFQINGGYTFVLDTLLHNHSVFEQFENAKNSLPVKDLTEYKELPDNSHIEEFISELRNFKYTLGANSSFSDYTPDELLSKLKSLHGTLSNQGRVSGDMLAAYMKLYNNLKSLFKINGGYTFILDTVIENQSVFADFETKKQSISRKLIGEKNHGHLLDSGIATLLENFKMYDDVVKEAIDKGPDTREILNHFYEHMRLLQETEPENDSIRVASEKVYGILKVLYDYDPTLIAHITSTYSKITENKEAEQISSLAKQYTIVTDKYIKRFFSILPDGPMTANAIITKLKRSLLFDKDILTTSEYVHRVGILKVLALLDQVSHSKRFGIESDNVTREIIGEELTFSFTDLCYIQRLNSQRPSFDIWNWPSIKSSITDSYADEFWSVLYSCKIERLNEKYGLVGVDGLKESPVFYCSDFFKHKSVFQFLRRSENFLATEKLLNLFKSKLSKRDGITKGSLDDFVYAKSQDKDIAAIQEYLKKFISDLDIRFFETAIAAGPEKVSTANHPISYESSNTKNFLDGIDMSIFGNYDKFSSDLMELGGIKFKVIEDLSNSELQNVVSVYSSRMKIMGESSETKEFAKQMEELLVKKSDFHVASELESASQKLKTERMISSKQVNMDFDEILKSFFYGTNDSIPKGYMVSMIPVGEVGTFVQNNEKEINRKFEELHDSTTLIDSLHNFARYYNKDHYFTKFPQRNVSFEHFIKSRAGKSKFHFIVKPSDIDLRKNLDSILYLRSFFLNNKGKLDDLGFEKFDNGITQYLFFVENNFHVFPIEANILKLVKQFVIENGSDLKCLDAFVDNEARPTSVVSIPRYELSADDLFHFGNLFKDELNQLKEFLGQKLYSSSILNLTGESLLNHVNQFHHYILLSCKSEFQKLKYDQFKGLISWILTLRVYKNPVDDCRNFLDLSHEQYSKFMLYLSNKNTTLPKDSRKYFKEDSIQPIMDASSDYLKSLLHQLAVVSHKKLVLFSDMGSCKTISHYIARFLLEGVNYPLPPNVDNSYQIFSQGYAYKWQSMEFLRYINYLVENYEDDAVACLDKAIKSDNDKIASNFVASQNFEKSHKTDLLGSAYKLSLQVPTSSIIEENTSGENFYEGTTGSSSNNKFDFLNEAETNSHTRQVNDQLELLKNLTNPDHVKSVHSETKLKKVKKLIGLIETGLAVKDDIIKSGITDKEVESEDPMLKDLSPEDIRKGFKEEKVNSSQSSSQHEPSATEIEDYLRDKNKAIHDEKERCFRERKAYEWSKSMIHPSPRTLEYKNFFNPINHSNRKIARISYTDLLFPQTDVSEVKEFLLVTMNGKSIISKDNPLGSNFIAQDMFTIFNKINESPENILDLINKYQKKSWRLIGGGGPNKLLVFERPKTRNYSFLGKIKSTLAGVGVLVIGLVGFNFLAAPQTEYREHNQLLGGEDAHLSNESKEVRNDITSDGGRSALGESWFWKRS